MWSHKKMVAPFWRVWFVCGVLISCHVGKILPRRIYVAASSEKTNCTIQWIRFNETTPSEVEPVGKEVHKLENGTIREYGTSYVGRAYVKITAKDGNVKQGVIPGKFIHKLRLYSYKGRSHTVGEADFEFLKAPRGSVSWITVETITNPNNLIVGGFDPEVPTEPYYICRFLHVDCRGTHLVNGKLSSNGICSVEFWGKEVYNTTYEALSLNAYGQILRSGEVNCS